MKKRLGRIGMGFILTMLLMLVGIPLSNPTQVNAEAPGLVVVLDAGHDGKHSGASYYGNREEVLNLKSAIKRDIEAINFRIEEYDES